MPKKKKTTASATLFRFVANDPTVVDNLTAAEIGKVKTWQKSDGYMFEFHEGHTTGDGKPIYIRPAALATSRELNVPKVNAVEANKGTYTTIANILNGGKLGSLDSNARTDLLNIIKDEWDALVILARRYWNQEDLPQVVQVRPNMTCTSCGAFVAGDAYLEAPNDYGKYKCPKCKKFTLK